MKHIYKKTQSFFAILLVICLCTNSFINVFAEESKAATYEITVNEVKNGLLSADKMTAGEEETITLSAELEEGYALYAWTVTDKEGKEIEVNENAFKMPASDVTVSARIYTAEIVELMNLLDEIDAMDPTLYTEESWDNLSSARESIKDPTQLGKYASMMTERLQSLIDELILVDKTATYEITVNEVENGLLSADKMTAGEEETITLSAELEEGYALYAWTVTDKEGKEIEVNENAFKMPASDVTVSARIYTAEIVELMNLLDEIDAMDPTLYTEESWDNLSSARESIKDPTQLGKYASMMTERLQSLIDELVLVEKDTGDSEFKLEDGYYILPVSSYDNVEKTITGDLGSAAHVAPGFNNRAMLKVSGGKYEITLRILFGNKVNGIGALKEENFNGSIMHDANHTWAKYTGNKCWFDIGIGEKEGANEENNTYWKDFDSTWNENYNTYDVTFAVDDISKDFLMYLNYDITSTISSSILEVVDFNEYAAKKVDMEEYKSIENIAYSLYGRINAIGCDDYISETLEWCVQSDSAYAKICFEEAASEKYSIVAGSKSADAVAIENNCFNIEFNLNNFNDIILGRTFYIKETNNEDGTSASLYLTLYPEIEEAENIELTEQITGSKIITNTDILSEKATLTASEILDDTESVNDPYTVIYNNLGSSYKNIYMYKWSILYPNGTESMNMSEPVQMKFKIPESWNADAVQLFGYYENYGFDPTVEGDLEEDEEGNKYFTITTSTLGWYALYETKDMSASGAELEDGTYSVPVSVYHLTTEGQLSMADRCLGDNATIVVMDSEKYLYMDYTAVTQMELTSYMTKMWIYGDDMQMEGNKPTGTLNPVIFTSYYKNEDGTYLTDDFNQGTLNYYPKEGYVRLVSDEAQWPARFKVPIMDAIGGGNFEQDAWLTLDWANAEKTSDATPDAPIKDALGEMLSIAETAVKEEYTPATWSVLEEAYKTAKDIYEKNSSTEEKEKAYTSLRDAVDALEKPEAMELEPGVYTVEDSFDQGDGVTQTRLLVSENETKVYLTLNGVKEFYYYDTENAKYTEPELETGEDSEGNQVIERAVITYASTPSLISVKYLTGDDETVTGSLTLNDCTKQEVTKEALAAALEQATKIVEAAAQAPEDYDGEKIDALVQAIAAATKVNSDPVAIQTEVDEQVSALEKAAAEAGGNTDEERTALEAAITAANGEAAKEDVYTASSITELKDLIASAQELLNGTPTASQIEAMTLRIQTFLEEGLILKADFTKLQELYDTAVKTAENADESYSGYANLTEIIKQAETILNNSDASQSEVDSMAEALTLAISALDDSVEKEDLRGLAEQAEKLISDGNYSGCTQATQELLNASLEAARAVLADPAATQSEVNKHYDMLLAADAAMVKEQTGLADGIYEADATVLHAADTDGTQLSMANSAVDKPVQVIVENGIPKAIRLSFHALTTTGLTGYLGNLWYFPGYRDAAVPNGQTPVQAEVETWYTDEEIGEDPYADYMDGEQYPKSMLIPIESDGNGVYYTEYWIQVFVPVMEYINTGSGTQYARLKLEIDDWSDMKQISGTVNTDKEELQKQLQVLKDFLEAISKEDADPSREDFRTEDLAVLEAVITAGTSADENMNIGQELVDSTVKALAAAETLFASESIESDKTALNEAIAKAEEALGLENVVYTEASRQNLEWILNAAKVVAGNASAEQAQITWWTTRLEQAVENLALISADKTELAAALETAEERLKETDLYTGASLDVLRSLYERAQELYDNAGSTQEDVDKYAAMLNYYVESMIPVQEGETFRDGLYSMLLTASNMAGRENSFTDSTLNALKAAIKAADAVYQDEDATQAEINEQASKLYYAILALEAKPAETPGTGTGDGGSGNDNNDDGNNGGNTDLDIENLADGVYSIYGEMVKTDKTSESMSNAAVNHTIKLTVKDGKYYITMNFNGLQYAGQYGYLKDLQYFLTGYTTNQYGVPQGNLADVTIDSYQTDSDGNRISDSFGTDYPDYVTFELIPEALEDGFVPLQVFVPIMESIADGTGTQAVYLKLDWSSLKLTEADDPNFEDDGNNDDNNNSDNNNDNGNGGSGLSGGSGLGNNTLGSTLGGSSLGGSSLGGSSLGGSSLGGSGLKSGSSLTGASSVKTDDTSSDISGWAAVLAIGCMVLLVGVMEKRSQKKNKGI